MKKNGYHILILCLLIVFSACSKKNDVIAEEDKKTADNTVYDWATHIPFKTNYGTFNMSMTAHFQTSPSSQGKVKLEETSGLGYSIKNPGKIWAHNDSGNASTIFLIDENTGEIVARYNVKGLANIDWEDMEVSVGPVEGESYIYISDTGDNKKKRNDYSVYRFTEPVYNSNHSGKTIEIKDITVDRIRFKYPDGNYDNESLIVDPLTKDIFLVTKSGTVSHLYVIPYPQKVNELYSIYKAGDFSFREASAATSSLDGKKVLIKNRQEIFYWERINNETMVQMLSRTPVKAPYAGELQGEAICFDDKYNYFTLSEKEDSSEYPILYKYNFKN